VELLVAASNAAEARQLAGLLPAMASAQLARHEAFAPGDTLRPAGPVVPGSSLVAFYCAPPTYFAVPLHAYEAIQPPVTMLWMIPVSAAEYQHIRAHGGGAFERLLVDRKPDLLDLHRGSMI